VELEFLAESTFCIGVLYSVLSSAGIVSVRQLGFQSLDTDGDVAESGVIATHELSVIYTF
jgi:hypothetical protein